MTKRIGIKEGSQEEKEEIKHAEKDKRIAGKGGDEEEEKEVIRTKTNPDERSGTYRMDEKLTIIVIKIKNK